MYKLKIITQNDQKSDVRVIDVDLNFNFFCLPTIVKHIQNLFPDITISLKEVLPEYSQGELFQKLISKPEIHILIDQPISGYKVELLNLLFSNHALYENFEIKLVEDTDETIDGYNKSYLLNNEWISVYLSQKAGLDYSKFVKEVYKYQKLSIAYCTDEADLLNKVTSLFDTFIEFKKQKQAVIKKEYYFPTAKSFILDAFKTEGVNINSVNVNLKYDEVYTAELDKYDFFVHLDYFRSLLRHFTHLHIHVFTSGTDIGKGVHQMFYIFSNSNRVKDFVSYINEKELYKNILSLSHEEEMNKLELEDVESMGLSLEDPLSPNQDVSEDCIHLFGFDSEIYLSEAMKKLEKEIRN